MLMLTGWMVEAICTSHTDHKGAIWVIITVVCVLTLVSYMIYDIMADIFFLYELCRIFESTPVLSDILDLNHLNRIISFPSKRNWIVTLSDDKDHVMFHFYITFGWLTFLRVHSTALWWFSRSIFYLSLQLCSECRYRCSWLKPEMSGEGAFLGRYFGVKQGGDGGGVVNAGHEDTGWHVPHCQLRPPQHC